MTDATFGLSRIGQIAINARDLERAVAFYRDVLGMRFLFQVPRMAFFDCGGIRVMLGLAERPEFDHPASILYYQVAQIAAAHRELAGRGVTFETAPHLVHRAPGQELWLAFLRDSEGNPLALMEERTV